MTELFGFKAFYDILIDTILYHGNKFFCESGMHIKLLRSLSTLRMLRKITNQKLVKLYSHLV